MDNDPNEYDEYREPQLPQETVEKSPVANEDRKQPRYGTWRMLQTAFATAFIVATMFIAWSPGKLGSASLEQRIADAMVIEAPQATATMASLSAALDPDFQRRIGLVVGHLGNDSGAVCDDGLQEVDVNLKIATYVQKRMVDLGYDVVLLEEFDDRLNDFKGVILLSIHADSCAYINDYATGFKVAAALAESKFSNSTRLVNCLSECYQQTTGMVFHYESVTVDMTYYHAFNEINPQTTAAIIETGFMNLDRQMLTDKAELLAEGIVAGLTCYLNNEPILAESAPTPTP